MTTLKGKDHEKNRVILLKQFLREGFTHVNFYRPYGGVSRRIISFQLLPRKETMNSDVYYGQLKELSEDLQEKLPVMMNKGKVVSTTTMLDHTHQFKPEGSY